VSEARYYLTFKKKRNIYYSYLISRRYTASFSQMMNENENIDGCLALLQDHLVKWTKSIPRNMIWTRPDASLKSDE
jgi:hypothetical protein